ncbi:T9SS C-terminal target domain-containing protein [Aquimarina sp. AD10]|uniref:starch-binding protein n=1 Tax=Aquimarina sp. AD10 TaxID=1714849 RepID=UPI000E53A546|nr:starch-binding protein [Aquimarina sp. AD10]AXT63439.1 T9SS C-terminal target domain-containing protein [Aquimarina sp. AD10]RKN00549.1 starch-binding protein [Aquimarina sp. AD10]
MKKLLLTIFVMTYLLPISLNSQIDFREETIYFLMTTRFFDGDPNNNAPTEWSSYNPDPTINPDITDPNDVTWRGDFKGLIQKLDYIKDLGFTAIWITPIVHNRSPLDYHGYHAWDFTRVDPRLESPGATFQDLINEIHSRDMKIVLDVVTNHAGRFGIKDVAEIKYNTNPDAIWHAPDNPNWEYDGLTPNPEDGLLWSRANLAKMPPPYNQNLAAFNFPSKENYVDTSDPDWYHHSGNGFAQGFDDVENLQNRALAGDTPDLNTSSPVVREYLVNAYARFINMGVDAFRWDTVKHMSREDIIYFYDAFKAINPDLFIFGEVAQKRHELHPVEETNPHYYTWRGDVNNSQPLDLAVIDFFGEATFHGSFEEGQSFPTVKAAARYDHLYSDPSTLVTWLDNHDFGPNNDWNRRYGGSDENLAACMNFMFTWRGIPTVYYGTEMRFKAGEFNDIHDASGIQQSINKTGRAYYGDVMDQAPNHKIYQHIKKLNAIRKAVPALQKGAWSWKDAPGNAVAYRRVHDNSEVAVGLAKDGNASFSISGMSNGLYRDAVTGREIAAQNGVLNFTVTSGSAGIYVLNGPGLIGGCGGGFFENCINGPIDPVVIINPVSSNSETPIQVTMQGVGGAGAPYQIYYTTDGTTPNTSSTKYSSSFSIDTSTTIKAIVYDKNGTASQINIKNFTIGPIEGLHVYFKKPNTWSQVNVHYWNTSPNTLPSSNWPGPQMSRIDNSDWYEYIFIGVESTNLLFNDNGGAKTDDLSRNRDGWYADGIWYDTDPRTTTNTPPTISATPSSGSFNLGETVRVELIATDNDSQNIEIYYTTNGDEPNTTSTRYTTPITLTTDTTIRAIAYDSEGLSSDILSNTYTFTSSENTMTVHYKGTLDNPSVYYWNTTPLAISTSWPGQSMTAVGNGWYTYTLSGVTCSNIIFSANGTNQTTDLNRCGDGWYYNGIWYDSNPEENQNQNLTVYFKSDTYTSPSIYFWNATPSGTSTSWPGQLMTADIDGWYRYTLQNTNCSNFIFSNNGASKTEDLNRCTEGWYYNGSWFDSRPITNKSDNFENLDPTTKAIIYPNPITQKSTLEWSTKKEKSNVRIAITNVYGASEIILNKVMDQGRHTYELNRENILKTSGVYFFKITIDGKTQTKKIAVY